jgi:hypothetical protein
VGIVSSADWRSTLVHILNPALAAPRQGCTEEGGGQASSLERFPFKLPGGRNQFFAAREN